MGPVWQDPADRFSAYEEQHADDDGAGCPLTPRTPRDGPMTPRTPRTPRDGPMTPHTPREGQPALTHGPREAETEHRIWSAPGYKIMGHGALSTSIPEESEIRIYDKAGTASPDSPYTPSPRQSSFANTTVEEGSCMMEPLSSEDIATSSPMNLSVLMKQAAGNKSSLVTEYEEMMERRRNAREMPKLHASAEFRSFIKKKKNCVVEREMFHDLMQSRLNTVVSKEEIRPPASGPAPGSPHMVGNSWHPSRTLEGITLLPAAQCSTHPQLGQDDHDRWCAAVDCVAEEASAESAAAEAQAKADANAEAEMKARIAQPKVVDIAASSAAVVAALEGIQISQSELSVEDLTALRSNMLADLDALDLLVSAMERTCDSTVTGTELGEEVGIDLEQDLGTRTSRYHNGSLLSKSVGHQGLNKGTERISGMRRLVMRVPPIKGIPERSAC